jgi:hypothetical protein
VEDCDKPGGAAKRALSPGFPMPTQGTETSQYLEEEKATATALVAASERAHSLNPCDSSCGGCRTALALMHKSYQTFR